MNLIFIYIILINLVAFIIYFIDKKKAINNSQRISENTLLLITLIGGTIGSLLSMFLFRHKIKKIPFILKYVLVILTQIIFVYFISVNYL